MATGTVWKGEGMTLYFLLVSDGYTRERISDESVKVSDRNTLERISDESVQVSDRNTQERITNERV